jgi:predicted DNA-binding transcriptional regulator AlpA
MKLVFLKCLIAVCLLFSVSKLPGQDTSIIRTITFPHYIRSMANDQYGDIFIESSAGLYQFDGEKYWLTDPNYDRGTLIYINGKLSNFNALQDIIDFIGEGKKRMIWSPFLPDSNSPLFIYHAKGRNGRQFIARGNHIHEVTIKDKFKIDLKAQSTRAIMVVNQDLYVNTYSGIFKNGVRILPDIPTAEGMLHDISKNSIYFSSDKNIIHLNLDNNKLVIENYFNEIGEPHYISKLIKYKNKIYLGTSKGIAQLKPFSFLAKEFLVHDISNIDGLLYLSTDAGTYLFDGKKVTKCNFLPDLNTNLVTKIGVNFWVLTKTGLWVYNTENKKLEEKILNKEIKSLECYAIQKDNNGYYWVSTSLGLYRFRNINEKTEVFFPEIEFNKRSFYQYKGLFYFGSVNGMYFFDPLDFPDLIISNGIIVDNLIGISIFLLLFIGFLIYLVVKRKPAFSKINEQNVLEDKKWSDVDKEKFLFDLGTYILKNLHFVTVEDLMNITGMNKKTFYNYLDQNYKIRPGSLINTIKVLKARALILENPSITMETVSKFTGYSASYLYKIMKEEEEKLPKEISILYDLKY